jgi:hypothetical protein
MASELKHTADDEWASALPGLDLQHDFRFTVADWPAWEEVSRRMSEQGAEVVTMQMARRAGRYALHLRLRAIVPSRARELALMLAALGLAEGVGVEHTMLATSRAAS